jgi:hypothetical protein
MTERYLDDLLDRPQALRGAALSCRRPSAPGRANGQPAGGSEASLINEWLRICR